QLIPGFRMILVEHRAYLLIAPNGEVRREFRAKLHFYIFDTHRAYVGTPELAKTLAKQMPASLRYAQVLLEDDDHSSHIRMLSAPRPMPALRRLPVIISA
ncbi:MAG: hypothetical protein ABI165_12680, partial [Bryobacteraceae bacterium]